MKPSLPFSLRALVLLPVLLLLGFTQHSIPASPSSPTPAARSTVAAAPHSSPPPVIPPPYEFPDEDRNTSGPGCPANGGNDPTQCSGYKVADDVEEVWRGQHPVTPARPQALVTTTPVTLTTYGDVQFAVAGDAVVQLPVATGSGNRYRFKNLTGSKVTFKAVVPQLIDGQPTYGLSGLNSSGGLVDTFCAGGVPCWAIDSSGSGGGAAGACQQDVGLVSGVGSFTSTCIVPQSYCECRDRTVNGNTCYTTEPVSGTVGVMGNASDTVQVMCSASLAQALPSVTSCQGGVPLVSGAGTFTASCVSTASYCSCRDQTAPGTACYTDNPVSGSVGAHGSGSDLVQVACTSVMPGLPGMANYSGPVNVTGTSGNGSDAINGVNVNGEIVATSYGLSPTAAPAANATALNNALTAANTAHKTVFIPAGVYPVAMGVDTKGVPVDCGHYRSTDSINYPVTLDFSLATSGVAITHPSSFRGCYLKGGYTNVGSGGLNNAVAAKLASVSESNGVMSFTLASAPVNPPIQTMGFRVEGTTNYDGARRALTVTDPQHLTARRAWTSNSPTETFPVGPAVPTAATEGGNTVTLTFTGHPFALGHLLTVTGMTPSGYNCTDCPVTSVTSTQVKYYTTTTGLTNGTVMGSVTASAALYYYPTVALQHYNEDNASNVNSCCDVNWEYLKVQGFGTLFDLSSTQTTGIGGSTDFFHVDHVYGNIAQIGFQMLGKGTWQDSQGPHTNVADGFIEDSIMQRMFVMANCGPTGVDSEGGCATIKFRGTDDEAFDTNYLDGTRIDPYIIGGTNINFDSGFAGSFAGAGQTMVYQVDFNPNGRGLGGNSMSNMVVSGTVSPVDKKLVNKLPSDSLYLMGGAGASEQQASFNNIKGSVFVGATGPSLPLTSVTCNNATACTGAAVSYALVCKDWAGFRSAPSAFVSSVNNLGVPAGPNNWSQTALVLRFPNDPHCASYDMLVGDTAHYVNGGLSYVPSAATGSNYFVDSTGPPGISGYPTAIYGPNATLADSTGGINLSGAVSAPPNGLMIRGPVLASNPPASDTAMVNDHAVRRNDVAHLVSYPTVVKADTPKGYWRLGEASGNFTDSSGNSNTATASGTITYSQTSGIVDDVTKSVTGSANALGTVAASASLPGGDVISVEFWFKRNATLGTQQNFWAQKTGGLLLYLNPSNQFASALVAGASIFNSLETVTDTNWHHFVFSKNGSASCAMYLDGVPLTFLSGAPTTVIAPPDSTEYLLSNNGSGGFPGSVSDIAVYNVALTQAQVTAHYNEGLSIKNGRIEYAIDGTANSCPITAGGGGALGYYTQGRWCGL